MSLGENPIGEDNHKSQSLTAQEWAIHINGWKQSSLAKSTYCRKHGLSRDSFYYWYKRLLAQSHAKQTISDFVELLPEKKAESEKIAIEITFPNQMRMHLSLADNKLISLIEALGHATAIIR